MKTDSQLEASIERFQRGFWNRQTVDRPPIGVVPDRVWSPIGFRREPLQKPYLEPAGVNRAEVRTEYEDCGAGRRVISDDWIPFVAAWRAVPWLEAMCGCRVHCASGSFAPERYISEPAELVTAPIPANEEWFERLRTETAALAADLPADCWVSTTILRGCSDVLAAMRGLSEFCLDMSDAPAMLEAAAARVNELHWRVLRMHFETIQPKLGGYGHIFGFWAPGPATVLQEDVMGLCAPGRYRDLFQRYNAELVARLGPYTLFHLHSTGYRHYRHVLEIPGIAGLQLTVEESGPPLAELVPALRAILERSRLILQVDGHFGEVPAALRALPTEGLYLLLSDKFVPDEKAYLNFVRDNF
jgi:hypothetical protein